MATEPATDPAAVALLVDFGGVLTMPTVQASRDWCAGVGITYRQFVGPLIAEHDGAPSLIHRLETGQLPVGQFEAELSAAITAGAGFPVDATGFVTDVVGGAGWDDAMLELVADIRARGVRTALLSNSWGNEYPVELLGRYFDELVISGDVGLRKPDPQIYRLAAQAVGTPVERCIFIDDLKANIAAADEVGMTGILHTDAASTRPAVVAALAALALPATER